MPENPYYGLARLDRDHVIVMKQRRVVPGGFLGCLTEVASAQAVESKVTSRDTDRIWGSSHCVLG